MYVPEVDVETTHVYVVRRPTIVGPVLLAHDVTPAVPEILHVKVPVGATDPVDPVTTEVNTREPPRLGEPGVVIDTAGVARATKVLVAEAVDGTGLYAVSPLNVNVAPYVPAMDPITLHVYTETFADETGPLVAAQVVIPVTPVTVHVPLPVAAIAEPGPVTRAVNVSVDPKLAVGELAFTVTVGVACVTVVVSPDVGDVE